MVSDVRQSAHDQSIATNERYIDFLPHKCFSGGALYQRVIGAYSPFPSSPSRQPLCAVCPLTEQLLKCGRSVCVRPWLRASFVKASQPTYHMLLLSVLHVTRRNVRVLTADHSTRNGALLFPLTGSKCKYICFSCHVLFLLFWKGSWLPITCLIYCC